MGGALDSAGGFLGLSKGPQAPGGQFGNPALQQLAQQNFATNDPSMQSALNNYAQGNESSSDVLGTKSDNSAAMPGLSQGLSNALATGATTGSKYAAEQMDNNATQSGLYGQSGQLGQAENQLSGLYNQGFNLTQGDQTMYGQEAGNIARQYGQQGNQLANSLASRGLSSSGAAGAQFSGLAGNQNEQLAGAQQQIAQQRYQNTMNQIGQYQNFVSSMGGQYNNALQQQYGRQLSGAQNQTQQLGNQAQLQNSENSAQNAYGMQSANFNASHTPKNFMDFATAGFGQGLQSGLSGQQNTENEDGSKSGGSGAAGLFSKGALAFGG